MSSSELFLFTNKAHLNSGVRLFLEFSVLCCSHQACCLLDLYHLCEITNTDGTFTFPNVLIAVLDLNKMIGESTDLLEKRRR